MEDHRKTYKILVAEDDPDDRLLISNAFEKTRYSFKLEYVQDGDSLISYLRNDGNEEKKTIGLFPDLILLDLNMPGMDGRKALKIIKSDKQLKCIPLVVLTTSRSEEDIAYSYKSGANSYIPKPDSFEALTKTVKTLVAYWFENTVLPHCS